MSADTIDRQRLVRLESPTDKLSGCHTRAANPARRTQLGGLQHHELR